MAKKISKKQIDEFTKTCMIEERVRKPDAIAKRIIKEYELPKGAIKKLIPVIEGTGKKIAEETIYQLLIGMLIEGTKDFRLLTDTAVSEGFDITQAQISDLIQKAKRNLRNETSKMLKEKILKRGKIETSTVATEASKARMENYRQKLMSTIEDSFYDSREKFLKSIDKTILIQLSRRMKKGENSINVYQGDYKGKHIFLKCTFDKDLQVETANLFFGRVIEGKIKGINLALASLKDKWSGDKGYNDCMKDIKKIHDFLGFRDIQQTIWFLSEFERYTVNLPTSLHNYLSEYFIRFMKRMEDIKGTEAITDLVKKKYHSFLEEEEEN